MHYLVYIFDRTYEDFLQFTASIVKQPDIFFSICINHSFPAKNHQNMSMRENAYTRYQKNIFHK